MAAVPVMITGVLWDDAEKEGKKVTLYGELTIAGLHVGGGPIPPGGSPPGIWGGPIDPYPGHPLPQPPGKPPGIWGGPIDPYPGHPLPEPPGKPPEPVQPPIDWKVIWTPGEGWVVVGVPNVPHPVPSK